MDRTPLRRRDADRSRRLGLIPVLAGTALLLLAGSAALVGPELVSAARDAEQTSRDDAALAQVIELRTAVADWQVFFEPHTDQADRLDATALTEGTVLAETVIDDAAAAVDGLVAVGLTARSGELASAAGAFTDALEAVVAVADAPVFAEAAPVFAAEDAAYRQLRDVTGAAGAELQARRGAGLEQAVGHIDNARTRGLVVVSVTALLIVVGAVMFGTRARREARAVRGAVKRERFERSLQAGLEMARTETAVYGILNRALHDSVPDLQVELLVADSSRAHFHRGLHTSVGGAEERSGCGVVSPTECPAAVRGDTIVFETSTAIDACPYLQDRASGSCSAACVPVNITGKSIGVLHATGPDHEPPDDIAVGYLETTTRRAADRITLLRAFAKSETQASTDPLTGLVNRRSLENQVRDLQLDGIAYAVAYADLDHFKALNDTHGHEAGDQALRLFSRVVRDSIRPNDIAGRYGGEEFVIVLPDCDTETATSVLERVREALALALATGRSPAFTVSFGLAASTDADTFDDIVTVADHALLAAKTAGRNRVIVAPHPTEQPVPPPVPTP